MVKKSLLPELKVNALKEGLLEFGRIALIAALPVLISQLEANNVDIRTILVIIIIALLKSLDKALHKFGEFTDNDKLVKGLTRF